MGWNAVSSIFPSIIALMRALLRAAAASCGLCGERPAGPLEAAGLPVPGGAKGAGHLHPDGTAVAVPATHHDPAPRPTFRPGRGLHGSPRPGEIVLVDDHAAGHADQF